MKTLKNYFKYLCDIPDNANKITAKQQHLTFFSVEIVKKDDIDDDGDNDTTTIVSTK